MGIKYFNIEYDRETFLPGQMVSGRVRLSLDKPKEIRAVELTLTGKAKCHWTKRESYTDSEGKSAWRDVSCDGKEKYFKTTLNLAGGGQKFELPIGDYQYPFTMSLPAPLPPSYSGTYGGISYYGKAKLDLPWARDKSEKKPFIVQSPIDLNKMTELNQPYKNEKSKTFCCWCCASGPLTVTVYIPRIGFVYTETMPITIDVDNASNVEINSIKIELNQIINWKASNDSKEEKTKMKSRKLAGVGVNASHSATEDLELGPGKYPNTGNCGIIKVRYELEIEMNVSGAHSDLEMKTPITIGDIPFGGSLPDPAAMGVGFVPPQPNVPPPTGFGFNPDPAVGFNVTYPANTGGAPQANYGAPYYPGGNAAPYPGATGAQYPGAPTQPYPGAPVAPYPGAPEQQYPGAAGSQYPAAGGAPYTQGTPQAYPGALYPGATSTPNAGDPYSQPAQNPYPEGSGFAMGTIPNAPAETNPLLENK